jgi:hypothetical protein
LALSADALEDVVVVVEVAMAGLRAGDGAASAVGAARGRMGVQPRAGVADEEGRGDVGDR